MGTAYRPTHQKDRQEERLLDKAIEDTFPASDPLSVTRAPKDKRTTPPPHARGRDRRPPARP